MTAALSAEAIHVRELTLDRASEERAFFSAHAWCIDPHPTAADAATRLHNELETLLRWPAAWQRREAAINVWLLASGILNAADEALRGKTIRLSPLRRIAAPAERLVQLSNLGMRRALRRWCEDWLVALEAMLPPLLGEAVPERIPAVLRAPLPAALAGASIGVPSPFERLDLAHEDVLALGRALMDRLPDRGTPLALIGLRTSGSYFVPLIRSQLRAHGYRSVSAATLEPNKGPDRDERKALAALAAQNRTAVLVDDPPSSGDTLRAALSFARAAGFVRLHILVPTHPAKRDWATNFPPGMVITLAPEQWHKRSLLCEAETQTRLADYLGPCRVVASELAERYTQSLVHSSSDKRVPRLKRVYEVERRLSGGGTDTLFVLAKSVGWGWYGARAYLAGEALRAYVPPLIGYRDGILYTRFLPQSGVALRPSPTVVANYVAARVRTLPLSGAGGTTTRNGGVRLLAKALSGAYGRLPVGTLARNRLASRLRTLPCPTSAWIDGNMQSAEWIAAGTRALKTDIEHHGLGKAGLNVADPAIDLADSILHGDFSSRQQDELIAHYAAASGDATIRDRLFIAKLLAGIWSMNQAHEQIVGPACGSAALRRANKRFLRAWHFLIAESARHAGRALPRAPRRLHAPLVFLDVDGVVDRRLFGYPTTSAAGLRALATLASHAVVLNTARSVGEVRVYCEAYNLCGGVAEYGSYVWNAERCEGRVLATDESLAQLDVLRAALKAIPGVFVDERYTYTVRAFTYRGRGADRFASLLDAAKRAEIGEGMVAPLPPVLLKQVMGDLGLDRVRVHPTTIDTTIVAREADKGTGLVAFRDWVLGPEAETIAVGDSAADLPMFRAATRAFAPATIVCRRDARLIGCEVASKPYQRGLLQIAQRIAGRGAPPLPPPDNPHDALIADLFAVADRPFANRLGAVLTDASAWSVLLR